MTFRPETIDPATWPAIFAVLEPGMIGADYTASDLVDELVDHTAQLWVKRKGGDPIAAAVSELVSTPLGLIVHGRLLAGKGMSDWLGELVDCIRAHAETAGAIGIEIDGRRGWERALAKYGFRRKTVTLALPLAAKVAA